MALSVIASQNQKTWDATVRVTGGHPLQLWGIGQSQLAAEAGGVEVDRVVARDGQERMVGYGQLQIRQEGSDADGGSTTVVECLNVHANRASAVPSLLDALADYAQRVWGAEMFSAELDAPSSPELIEAIGARGWQRTGAVAEGEGGPRRLRVNLGSSEHDLSSRLPEQTLERCRSGLRVSDVTVREVTTASGDVRAAGLKTEQITRLLRELGQDSLLLVATQEKDGEEPTALGYLWFVHTVGQAMLYRVGFTRTARELGIDDALLLTGAVELQKRGVQRLDGGDAADPDVPTVVRELADRQRVILGPWRKPLGDLAAQLSGPDAGAAGSFGDPSTGSGEDPERGRRGLFGRRPRREGDARHSAKTGHGRGAEDVGAAADASAASASASPASSGSSAAPAGSAETASASAAADRAAARRRDVVRRQVSSDLGDEGADRTPAPSSTAVEDTPSGAEASGTAPGGSSPAGSADAPKAPDAPETGAAGPAPGERDGDGAHAPAAHRSSGAKSSGRKASDRKAPGRKPTGAAAADAQASEATASGRSSSAPQTSKTRTSTAQAGRTRTSTPAARTPEPAAAAGGRGSGATVTAAPGAVDTAGARRDGGPSDARGDDEHDRRRSESEQRRAERLARKAAEVEAQRRPKKPPLTRRLRDEARAAMRDALGR